MEEVNPTYNPQADTMRSIEMPNYVGGYRLGNDTYHTQFNFTHKPNWFHRAMMRLCFGWKWVNL
jgi:hypothetical protein